LQLPTGQQQAALVALFPDPPKQVAIGFVAWPQLPRIAAGEERFGVVENQQAATLLQIPHEQR
jgi:hypothetical protein